MSDDQDQSEKTEDPTQKKLTDARNKGQVATSSEVNTWVMLTAGALIALMLAPAMLGQIKDTLTKFIAQPHAIPADFEHLRLMLVETTHSLVAIMAVAAASLVVAGAASGFIQHGFIFSGHSLKPELSKLSLVKGFKRLFSLKSLVEFLKGQLKLVIVGLIAAFLVIPDLGELSLMVGQPPSDVLNHIYVLSLKMMAAVVGAMTVIAAVDFMYQKFEHSKKQRMSKREVKDEHKQTEGDPIIKARLRAIRQERARKRMMAAVPEADVVITNPTHYAVALKYERSTMEAPVLVAKGADLVAKRIRELAQDNDVPIVENPPLSRALFQSVEIDQMIPVEHYKAVAEIISYVLQLKSRFANRPGSAPSNG